MQGKGTFVAKPKVAQLLELASYTEGMRAHGLHPQTKILDIGYVTADEQLAALLGIRAGGRALRIHRLRLADGEPMSIDTSHLPARRFPGLRKQLERQLSLYETLRLAYGIQLAEAEETIETVLADPHDARLLGVDPGLPLLLLSRHAYDVTGEPVEWAQSWYRGDRYKFVTRLRRPRPVTPRTHLIATSLYENGVSSLSENEPGVLSYRAREIPQCRGRYGQLIGNNFLLARAKHCRSPDLGAP